MQHKLMTHIVAGYPDLKQSEKIALTMAKCGVDFIEIQIPFSDPVADGPVIMKANDIALRNGIHVKDCFDLAKKIMSLNFPDKPKILFMSYFNVIFRYGIADFCRRAKQCGCYGLIVPDMPLDEEKNEHYLAACKKYKLHAIQIISPLTPKDRLKKLAKVASGFLYCVSRYGTTGQSKTLNPKLKQYLKNVRRYFKIPLAVGFGISSRSQVEAVHQHAEIAVIGSRIITAINNKESIQQLLGDLQGFKE